MRSGFRQLSVSYANFCGNLVREATFFFPSARRQDFKRPLVNSQPPLVSQRKVDTMFFRLEEILQCHTLFGIALTQCVCEWDERERIGDVFLASVSSVRFSGTALT